MKTGKRRIILKRHFVERWLERIGPNTPGQIKRRLHSALVNKVIYKIEGGFAVKVEGCSAVCVLDETDTWVFITLLSPDMRTGEREEVG